MWSECRACSSVIAVERSPRLLVTAALPADRSRGPVKTAVQPCACPTAGFARRPQRSLRFNNRAQLTSRGWRFQVSASTAVSEVSETAPLAETQAQSSRRTGSFVTARPLVLFSVLRDFCVSNNRAAFNKPGQRFPGAGVDCHRVPASCWISAADNARSNTATSSSRPSQLASLSLRPPKKNCANIGGKSAGDCTSISGAG